MPRARACLSMQCGGTMIEVPCSSQVRSFGRLEQRRKTRDLFLQIVAQLGSRKEKVLIRFAASHRILVRDDDQSDVLARRVAEGSLNDEFPDRILGAVPAGIKESDPGFDDHDVIRTIRAPNSV